MRPLKLSTGFTLVETVITAAVISFMILGSINLITRVYKGITSSQFKSYSINLGSENLEFLKQQGFNSLNITPDSCLPDPLSKLDVSSCASNPYPPETVPFSGRSMTVYKVVQYAVEDSSTGNIVPKTLADMGSGYDMNTKQVAIIVAYELDGMTKTTRITGLVTNREVDLAGSTIRGRIYKQMPDMSLATPGTGSNASVYFVGYPGYTTIQYNAAGEFQVEGVMPGSYVLYAQGLGMAQGYYASNPLNVTLAGSTITGVTFTCAAIEGAIISGHAYINITMVASATPTISPTEIVVPTTGPTPITQILPATGLMASKVQQWTDSTYISAQDNNGAKAETPNQFLYTEFADYTIADSTITSVRMYNRIVASLCGTGTLQLMFTNNSGINWNNNAVPDAWSNLSPTLAKATLNYTGGWVSNVTDITNLYAAGTWTWARVNALGAALKSIHGASCLFGIVDNDGYCDYSYLAVDFIIATPTPTTAAPTNTPTPTPIPTDTPIPCADGSIIRAMDGLSNPTTSGSCNYLIQDINPAGGITSLTATFSYGGKSYYAYVTGVPIALGVTTTVDIWLEESTGVPTLNGFVFDAVNRTLPITGANVYLTDPGDISPTTTGGGSYTIMPATAGTWTVWASMPGYLLEASHNISINPGINNAPNMYLLPAGDVSGRVTNEITGDPEAGITILIKDSSNILKGSGYTLSDGTYRLTSITAGSNYKVYVDPGTNYSCTYPVSCYHSGVTIVQGAVTANKNFRIKEAYDHIRGFVQVDGTDVSNGVVVLAYPSSVTNVAHLNRIDISAKHLQGQTGKWKTLYPYTGYVGQRDASYDIMAPVGQTYNIYAYYSYISYTGTVNNPTKTLLKYYKRIQNVQPNTSGNNITGALSTWTAY